MSKVQTLRAYLGEPILAALLCSLLVNVYGPTANAEFMHSEARDILALLLVLLGASIALWAGLFFIMATDFGKWLDSRKVAEPVNTAYIASSVIFLIGSVICIICAHVGAQNLKIQILGEGLCLWSLAVVIPMLNNTRHLLKLIALHRTLPKQVTEFRQGLPNIKEKAN